MSALPIDGGRGADHAGHLLQLRDLGAIVGDAARL